MATPNAGPFSPIRDGRGHISVVSSFGLSNTQLGPQFPALQIISSERSIELNYRSNFYLCRQHDWKTFDWNGTFKRPQKFPTQPLVGNSTPDFYVPLNQRRPSTPYRLARTIVGAFTMLIFGHGRWPNLMSDDPQTQDFAEALVKASKLKTKMIRARNLGGSCGTVGMSWGFHNGSPRVRVHTAKSLYVEEWEDEDELIPAHVVELYQYPKDVWDERKQKHVRKFFWHRRDWTTDADIEFTPCEVTKENPSWQVDEDRTVMHNDGVCHFVWVQNLPDDDVTSIDGQPDYAETYEQLDSIDILNSTNVYGATKNLDPTLLLKMHQEDVGGVLVKKGSDNALVLGPGGDARYMELSGTAVTAGHSTIDKQRDQTLETCQCVVTDPSEAVGAGMSSVALKIIYAPMISKGDIMRDQYGDNGIVRLIEGMIQAARKLNIGGIVQEEEVNPDGSPVIDEETGEAKVTDVEYSLTLPPKRDKIEILDAEGNPTGEFSIKETIRVPGNGSITLEWPDYFAPTADDKQKIAGAMTTATGGKPVMSQRTAVEQIATSAQRDPQEEWNRVQQEAESARRADAAMFPGVGGQVENVDDLPDGADPLEGEEDTDGENERPTDPTEE